MERRPAPPVERDRPPLRRPLPGPDGGSGRAPQRPHRLPPYTATRAIKRSDEEGVVRSALEARCIACSNCVLVCPFDLGPCFGTAFLLGIVLYVIVMTMVLLRWTSHTVG